MGLDMRPLMRSPINLMNGTISIYNRSTGSLAFGPRASLLFLGSWAGHSIGANPQDANEVIGMDVTATWVANSLQCNSMVRLIPFQNVYIHPSEFGLPNQSQGPLGETSIVRRVPVDQSWCNIISSLHMASGDHIDVRGMQMEALSFCIRDVNGRLVDLKRHGVSLSVVFSTKETFQCCIQ